MTLIIWEQHILATQNEGFTVACWSAITSDSNFMFLSCREQSELRQFFWIRINVIYPINIHLTSRSLDNTRTLDFSLLMQDLIYAIGYLIFEEKNSYLLLLIERVIVSKYLYEYNIYK